MRPYVQTLQPGEVMELAVEGRYFRIHDAAVPITVETRPADRKSRAEVTLSEGNDVVTAPFTALRLSHQDASPQTVTLYISKEGQIRSSAIAGTVSVDNLPAQQGGFTQGRASVTNANQALIAANASRRYLQIQNNDAAAVLRFTLDGNPATSGQGFRLQPGDSFDMTGFAASGAVNVIMETATATADNVEFCEG